MFSTKIKLAIFIAILAVVVFLIIRPKLTNQLNSSNEQKNPATVPKQVSQKGEPQIVSTKPDPLEDSIIAATDSVEITFNRPLQNVGEFKSRIEPNVDYKVELSSDRKTAKIIPVKGFLLGTTYTLFIGPETKFDGVGRWGQEKIYHFKTITYQGV